MNNIPLVDLRAQWENIKEETLTNISKAIDKADFILGSALEEFEKSFAEYTGVKYSVGVNSGTDALFLALKAFGVKKGDEVITPNLTYISTALTAIHCGATPVLVDINPANYTIDTSQIRKKISKKTKAIIPVHLYGYPADMGEIIKICKEHNLYLLEDCAQAHGAKFAGGKVGGFGDFGAFSFYPSKNLGAFGDGGIITTNSDKLHGKILQLRNYGQKKRYEFITLGYNSRLDNLQASILNVKLKYLDDWNERRRSNAVLYMKYLAGLPIELPPHDSDKTYQVHHVFVIRTPKRDKLLQHLKDNGISAIIHYPRALSQTKSIKDICKFGNVNVSEKYASQVLSLPLYPELTQSQIEYICGKVKEFFA